MSRRVVRVLAVTALLLAALSAASVSSAAKGLPPSLKPFARAVRATAAGAFFRDALAGAPQFDAALAALVAAIAQADQLARAVAAAAPSSDVVQQALAAAAATFATAFGAANAAWAAALDVPQIAAATAAAQQAADIALTYAAPALELASPLVSHWHAFLNHFAAMPPAHSLAAALAALYYTCGRAARKATTPRLPLGPLSVAASHARLSFAELSALSEAMRFSLVAAAPANAVVPPAQRKEASVALAALVTDTEALLAALQRAQAAALAGGKPMPVTPSGATSRSGR